MLPALALAAAIAGMPPQHNDSIGIDTPTVLVPTRYDLTMRVDLAAKRIDADSRITIVNRGAEPAHTACLYIVSCASARSAMSAGDR